MSERTSRRPSPVVAAALVGAMLLTGCAPKRETGRTSPVDISVSAAPVPSPTRVPVDMDKPCYDKPIPEPQRPATPEWEGTITLTQNPQTFAFNENPWPLSEQVRQKIKGAALLVGKAGNASGSGVLVNVPGREEFTGRVMLTAAHVDGTEVTDTTGKKASVVDTCVIYQDNGGPVQDRVGTADVRISLLDKAVGTSAVNVAAQPPERGQWGATVDYHSYRGITPKYNDPYIYTMMFVSGQEDDPRGVVTLTGIGGGAWTINQEQQTQGKPGSSGAGIFDPGTGNLLSIHFAGGDIESLEELASENGVVIEPDSRYGKALGADPERGIVNPLEAISFALASPAIRWE